MSNDEKRKLIITPFLIAVPIMFWVFIWFVFTALKDGGGVVLAIPGYAGMLLIASIFLLIDRRLVKKINVLPITIVELIIIGSISFFIYSNR